VAFAVRLLNNLCHDFSLHREPPGYNLVLSFATAHIFFLGIVSYHANESGCRRLDTGYLIFFSRDITNRIIGAYGVYDVGPLYLYYIMVCSGLGPAFFLH